MAVLAGCVAGRPADPDLPIFDAHVHYSAGAWGNYPTADVRRLFDDGGVRWALVSSSPVEGTLALVAADPGRSLPALRPYRGAVGPRTWLADPGAVDYLEGWLAKGEFRALGEVHVLEPRPGDRAVLARVAALARRHAIPLHLHADAAVVDLVYELEPGVTVLWAHAGMVDPVEVVERTLAAHPTLHADLSFREDAVAPGGRLDPDWRRVLLRFHDRLLVGSDTYATYQWADYAQRIRINRAWLAQLPEGPRRDIAYRNGLRLFGLGDGVK
ncbi:MAG: amidohydrolase [Hyphomicrobiales bacterium]|nr:amidohydrolase [Hyphomicrobiales bacterium]